MNTLSLPPLDLFRTRRFRLTIVAFGSIACAVSGCVALPIPHQRLHAFGVRGQIVSAATEKPIAGAWIEASDNYDETVRSANSDAEGRFCIKPKRGWHAVYIFGVLPQSSMPDFDIPHSEVRLAISAAGFTTRHMTWGGHADATEPGDPRPDGCYASDVIVLEPNPK